MIVGHKIDSGTYGEIYSSALDKTELIKICPKMHHNYYYSQQMLQEIVFSSMCSHPNIIKQKSVLLLNNKYHLVMENGGQNLFAYFRTIKAINDRIILLPNIILQIASGLDYMHKNKIAHGDLKQTNIVYDETTKKIKLIDFGGIMSFRTNVKHDSICTPGYISPETIEYDGNQTYASDIWAFAVIILQCINPYFDMHLDYKTVRNFKKKSLYYNLELSQNIKKNMHMIDPELSELLNQMMVFDPTKRITIDGIFRSDYFKKMSLILEKSRIQDCFAYNNIILYLNKDKIEKTGEYRKILLEWLYDICKALDIFECLCLCVLILDIYTSLECVQISITNLQAIGSACLIITTNMLLSNPLNTQILGTLTDKAFTPETIEKTIDLILEKLKYKVYYNTFDNEILQLNNQVVDYECVFRICKNISNIGFSMDKLINLYELEKRSKRRKIN